MFRPYTRAVSVGNFKRPVAAGGGGGFIAGDLPFNDITSNGYGNTVTATKSGTIYLSGDFPNQGNSWGGSGNLSFYKNNSQVAAYGWDAPEPMWDPSSTISISTNDQLKFYCDATITGETTNGTITIKNNNDSGSTIETIIINLPSGCLLTTAVVQYMGLLDNGPELTAMRALRSHYIAIEGYAEIIAEYGRTSLQIISAIEAANAESTEYTYIYNTVVAVMNHVNAEEWQQAHDLYMAMYQDLKSRYLTNTNIGK